MVGQAMGLSRVTHKLCCFETPHVSREGHCTLLSLQQLNVDEQAYVTLAGGSRARWEGTTRACGSWLTVAQPWAVGAEETFLQRFYTNQAQSQEFSLL